MKIQHPVALFVTHNDASLAETLRERERNDGAIELIDLSSQPLLSAPIALAAALRALKAPAAVMRLLAQPRLLPRIPQIIHLAQSLGRRGIRRIEAIDDAARPVAAAVASLLDTAPVDDSMLAIDWTPLGAQSLAVRWIAVRLDAAVAEVVVHGQDGESVVIVKQHRLEPRGKRARHEADSLKRLGDVPRVLLFDETLATIVMERAAGTSLDRMFAIGDHPQLLAATERAGRWLRSMQDATREDTGAEALLQETVERAVRDANAVMGGRAAAVVARLRELAASARTAVAVGHHGDYWPGNIFIDGERVTVIDFEGFRTGLPLEDVAYFLIRADMLCRRYRLRILPELREAFLRGYGETPRDALRLFTLVKGLRTLANDTGGNLPLPLRLWTRRTVRRAVTQALR